MRTLLPCTMRTLGKAHGIEHKGIQQRFVSH
jgi:hypothetical protein